MKTKGEAMIGNRLYSKVLLLVLGVLLLGGSVSTEAQRRRPVLQRRTVTRRAPVARSLFAVPAGTTLRARLNQTISSKTATIGQRVTATVIDPVYSSTGVLVIPQGSTVSGRVDSVVPAAKGGGREASICISRRSLLQTGPSE